MNILVDLPEQSEVDEPGNKSIEDSYTVALIDGMAEVQTLTKPDWIKNCEQLAEHFSSHIFGNMVIWMKSE